MHKHPPELRIGRLPFLVCAPFFHAFIERKYAEFAWIEAPPSTLNDMLFRGEIHAAPSSSFEYLKHWRQYFLLPDYCTASTLEIRSVKLFSHVPLQSLNGRAIYLTPQSATSVALWHILATRYQIKFARSTDAQNCAAKLLIGDEALNESSRALWEYEYDLATLWQQEFHLPFVFGLWIVHKQVLEHAQLSARLAQFRNALTDSLRSFYEDPDRALRHWMIHYPGTLDPQHLHDYYQAVDYRFGEKHRESLRLFATLCLQHGLIEETPEWNFLS